MDEVRDKQVYDMIADDYGILLIIVAELLKFTWNTGMVNIFTDQLLQITNNSQYYCHFTFDHYTFKYFMNSKW